MKKFDILVGIPANLSMINIDTDMIIPKQFLKTIKRTGLGKNLFFEMRYDDNEKKIEDFVLNKEPYNNSSILLTGKNFGCGSSREHAPWALLDFGIRCIISSSFADIFYNNCFKNGMLPLILEQKKIDEIIEYSKRKQNIEINLTKQEVKRQKGQENIVVPEVIEKLIEQVAIEARGSEFIDAKSGVSARLPISAYENVLSAVERRMLINGDEKGIARIGDLTATIPAIIGKIEMVYEGEQEGASNIARRLINQAIRSIAPEYFNNIQHLSDKRAPVELKEKFMLITSWFESGQRLDLLNEMTQSDFENEINNVSGLEEKVEGLTSVNSEKSVLKEFLLTALAAYSLLERKDLKQSVSFQDYFSSVVGGIG